MDHNDRPELRISGPVDLITTVPYLLGFHPTDSLVLVGLTHGALVVTARIDLADTRNTGVITSTVSAMRRGGATHFIATIFTEPLTTGTTTNNLPHADLADSLTKDIHAAGGELLDCLLVNTSMWWSYLCANDQCCPREGNPLPPSPTPGQVAATVAGMVALPSRAELAAEFEPEPDRGVRLHGIDQALAALRPGSVDGKLSLPARLAARAITAAMDRWVTGDDLALRDADIERIGAALRLIPIRDAIWTQVDARATDGHDRLWLYVARRLPNPYDAAPLFLYAWAAFRRGDGARANIAVERALASDCHYSAARLLTTALQRGVHPGRIRDCLVTGGSQRR